MSYKHNKVLRKFEKTINVDDWEILTDEGWSDIKHVSKTVPYEIWNIQTDTKSLKCADNHIVFNENMQEVFVKELHKGDRIQTDVGVEQIIDVVQTNNTTNMFDIELCDNSNHRYFTNGILSHNSSVYCMYVLWLLCFHPDKSVMILAQKESTALEILKKIRDGYLYLPTWLKPACKEMNKKSMTFGNRSSVHGFSSSAEGARGMSASILILDEFAFVPKNVADKLFTSVYPVVSSAKDGKVIIVSTPNGTSDNLFYDIWKKANSKDARKNVDGWKAFTMWWWQVPGHDEKWKQAQIETIGAERFAQEFNNEFLANSSYKKLIPDEVIERFRMRISDYKTKNILQGKDLSISSKDGKKTYVFKVYHEFQPNRTYMASGDCGEGIGGDASVLYIWDITDTNNINLCLRFSDNRVSLIEFAYVTNELLKLYANPFLAIESNGIGVGYIEQLRRVYEYDNIVRLNRENGYGINSHQVIKSKACIWAQEMFTTKGFDFELPDKELVEEMATFIKKDTVKHDIFAAIGDNHDDHIISMIWMMWILNEENLEKYYIVTDTFNSSLGKVLPKNIQPLAEYTTEEITRAMSDPIYRDFVEFQKMAEEKYKNAIEQERLISLGDKVQMMEQLNGMTNHQIVQMRTQKTQSSNSGCLFSFGGSSGFDDWGGNDW